MLPSLYASEWYNGQEFEKENFFSNKKMFIVSLPRLRQARINPGKRQSTPWPSVDMSDVIVVLPVHLSVLGVRFVFFCCCLSVLGITHGFPFIKGLSCYKRVG